MNYLDLYINTLTAKDGDLRLYSFIAEIDVVAPCV